MKPTETPRLHRNRTACALLLPLPSLLSSLLLLAACAAGRPPDTVATTASAAAAATAASTPAATAASAAAPAAPPPLLPLDDAVLSAATSVLAGVQANGNAAAPAAGQRAIVIDPLIDGFTGMQTLATKSIGERLAAVVRERYPQLDVRPFSAASVARNPLVLIGTFTGVNAQRQAAGVRSAYRICFALADLQTGKLVGKGLAFARPEGVDATPLPSFRDAPSWTDDPSTMAYVRTCQGTKAGDPINALYADRIVTAAIVADAVAAYDAGRWRDALDLYTAAQRSPTGDQFRVYNGIYLANWRLGRKEQADAAFRQLVDYGLAQKRLAVKFLFRPGSAAFDADARLADLYALWVKAIGARAAASASSCLQVTGHTSASGPEPLNERLSQLRADFVKTRLQAAAPALGARLITSGAGSRETMVGNGRDDASDALDRRVEFKVIGC